MTLVSDSQLESWTREASEYMRDSGRKLFPSDIQDYLAERGARRCSRCETVKRLEEFSSNRSERKGIHGTCTPCMRRSNSESYSKHRQTRLDSRRDYYGENRERELERSRAFRVRSPWATALNEGYRRAQRAGLPAEKITEKQLLEFWAAKGIDPYRCIYTGVELVPFVNRSLDHKTALSVLGSPGHVLSNLVPADRAVNTSKRNRGAVEYVITRTNYKETVSA